MQKKNRDMTKEKKLMDFVKDAIIPDIEDNCPECGYHMEKKLLRKGSMGQRKLERLYCDSCGHSKMSESLRDKAVRNGGADHQLNYTRVKNIDDEIEDYLPR